MRSGDALERLAKTRKIIFDKTGTLTTGKPQLINAADIDPQVLSHGAAIAGFSSHPLSRALSEFATGEPATEVEEHPGLGLSGKVGGSVVKLGSAAFVGTKATDARVRESWIKVGDQDPVQLIFEDRIRDEAASVIKALRNNGIPSQMISGDHPIIARKVAKGLGIDDAHGHVSPAEKLRMIERAQTQGEFPLMVGDGINDAPALASANASASLATASDISRAAADVILQHDDISNLPFVIQTAKISQRRIRENLGLAAVYNFLAVPLAIFGFVTPLLAALAMSGSSLLVTLNALRMKT